MCFIQNYRVDVWLFWFRLFQNGVGEEDESRSIGDGLLPLPKGLKPLINYRIPNPHQLFNKCSAMSQEPANPANQVEHSQSHSGHSQKFTDLEFYFSGSGITGGTCCPAKGPDQERSEVFQVQPPCLQHCAAEEGFNH